MKKIGTLLFLLIAGFVLVACGGAGQPAATPVSFAIDMAEYTFTPASLDLKVGQQVTLNMTNSGQLQHEIMFGREVMKDENTRPVGYMVDMFETAGVAPEVTQEGPMPMEGEEGHVGFMVILPVGGAATVTFPVNEAMVGQWEMGCFEQDGVHYDAGMKGPVTVSQ
ncbi:MAG TPA: hypothetical protein VI776_00860 [Anaerolineales bacterium]|nr:hypothetical protein [Anaerolineales bacterium]